MAELTSEQKSTLDKHGSEYKSWINTEDGKEDLQVHRAHEKFFKEILSPENIKGLDETRLLEIAEQLWAINKVWTRKDWFVKNKWLARNDGIENIREGLISLLYSDEPIAQRYDEFKNSIKEFGPSMLTEILHFVFPEKYCLWNAKPMTVLPALNLDVLPEKFFPLRKMKGRDYEEIIQALELIKNHLQQYGVKDFVDLDVFFWHIFSTLPETKEEEIDVPIQTSQTSKIDSHEEAQFYLLKLGNLLGYHTYTADPSKIFQGEKLGDIATLERIPEFAGQRDLVSAKNVDVIWFDEDHYPSMCFEVEHTTGVSPGLQRLYQLKQFRTKLIVIASEDLRTKFDREMEKSPYRNVKDYRFISYDELIEFFDSSKKYHMIRSKLVGE